MNETATKNTWKNIPIDNPNRIDIDFLFTEKQFSKLTKGLIPQQMEDKWFIYYENEWLNFHRSWTGNGMYKAKLNKVADLISEIFDDYQFETAGFLMECSLMFCVLL